MLSFAERLQPCKYRRVVGRWHRARAAQPVVKFMIRHVEQRGKRLQPVTIEFRQMQRGKGAKDGVGFLEAAVRGAEPELLAADFGWSVVHPRAYTARRARGPAENML